MYVGVWSGQVLLSLIYINVKKNTHLYSQLIKIEKGLYF